MKFVYGKQDMTSLSRAEENCWLLTNGLGGYASASAAFSATRGDQGMLVAAVRAPNVRVNLVRRLSERLIFGGEGGEAFFLSTQSFADGRAPEDGYRNLSSFVWDGMPKWVYQQGGVQVTRRAAMAHGENTTAVCYTVENRSGRPCRLRVTPVLAFIPEGMEEMQPIREARRASAAVRGAGRTLHVAATGTLLRFPVRTETLFWKDDERDGREETGVGAACLAVEALVRPGETGELELILSDRPCERAGCEIVDAASRRAAMLAERAGLKDEIARELVRSADAFIVDRASTGGKSLIAGYPFFGDWGRDTMIALPGCALATGRTDAALSILRTFLAYERDGLIPNLFPEGEEEPRYNTVDAALLLINGVFLYWKATGDGAFVREAWPVMARIVRAYREGTRYAIRMDEDGLIEAGSGMDQVTWMDVCVNGILPTPRHGKPVEINAYWYNALRALEAMAPQAGEDGRPYGRLAGLVSRSFVRAFWMEEEGYLKDVISGTAADRQMRCNQIWAVAMPFTMLSPEQERRVVNAVFRKLYTPCGLRTLSPDDAQFQPFYGGSQLRRDLAYHQGTVWPFPLGAYYLAYLKTRGNSREAAARVREQLEPLEVMLREGCVGQIPEIYDGGNPGASRGCFAQAWSVGEMLRVYAALERIENADKGGLA